MRLQSVFPLIGLSPNDPASYHASSIIPDALGIQHILSSLAASHSYAAPVVPAGDPAGRPNLATRLEITSPKNSTLFCATEGDKHQSGWAHFTNALGKEDKHMFWTFFEARNDSENAPIILYFGGGPGTSGLAVPFSGQGPCQVVPGDDGKGTAVPSLYPWTDFANILSVDYPVGAGFSFGDQASLRNSSERAAWDMDDLLQAFWRENPHFTKNQFAIGSGSYGGTYIPNLVHVIRNRNIESVTKGNTSRLLRMPETVMMSNPYSDHIARHRYMHVAACDDMGYFNTSVCEDIVRATPGCLDASQLAFEQSTVKNRYQSLEICADVMPWDKDDSGQNPYDRRAKCKLDDLANCFPSLKWIENIMNGAQLRKEFGVAENVTYKFSAIEEVFLPFAMNGDHSQRAYKLLTPAINDGMRLLVFNGVDDAVCPSRATESWLRLLASKHQSAFRGAPEIEWPGVGTFYSVGSGGAGELAFVKIDHAGHFVVPQRPGETRHLVAKWLRNERFA